MRETAPSELPIRPEQAKAKVFEQWGHLDALVKRRFPKDENLAHEALLYVLKNLEADYDHASVAVANRFYPHEIRLPSQACLVDRER